VSDDSAISAGESVPQNAGMNQQEAPAAWREWEATREAYVDWCSQWKGKAIFERDFTWEGMSLWWITTLVQKSLATESEWLMLRLHRQISADNASPAPAEPFQNRLKLLVRDLSIWAVGRILFRRQPIEDETIWFLSRYYNLKCDGDVGYDRQYFTAPSADRRHGLRAGFLVWLTPGKADLARPLRWAASVKKNLASLQRGAVILNQHLRLADILAVHWRIFLLWAKFTKLKKNPGILETFRIRGHDCSKILLLELDRNFFGEFQDALLYGMSYRRCFEQATAPQVIVTYGELNSTTKPIYHLSRKLGAGHCFISIQHGMESRNEMMTSYRRREFAQDGNWEGLRHSPMPDYYLVQGSQFFRILSEFYPENRIRIIGCLKYDALANRDEIATRARSVVRKSGRKILLLAPSIGDTEQILQLMKGDVLPLEWQVVVSPHPLVPIGKFLAVAERLGVTQKFETFPGLRTIELLPIADLVLCGVSSTALEAVIFGIPVVRAAIESLPQVDHEPEIPFFTEPAKFRDWLHTGFARWGHSEREMRMEQLAKRYFHAIDGCAAQRMWEFIAHDIKRGLQ
jgi:hypothetical protein